MLKPVKKTKAWNAIRAKLKKEFEAMGVTTCEICGSGYALSFAHRKPRRYCDEEELKICALLCQKHHAEADAHGHDYMFGYVNGVIEARNLRLKCFI